MPDWVSANEENVNWLFLLLLLTTSSFLGAAVPRVIEQLKRPRFHNVDRFINEWLARTHIAFVSYYFTLLLVIPLQPSWLQRGIQIMVLFSVFFFVSGLYYAAIQDDKIATAHQCPRKGMSCPTSLRGHRAKIYGVSIACAIFTSLVAITITFSKVVLKAP
jgi:hypothetical protein